MGDESLAFRVLAFAPSELLVVGGACPRAVSGLVEVVEVGLEVSLACARAGGPIPPVLPTFDPAPLGTEYTPE